MARNLTQKLLAAHVDGELPTPGEPIALAFDQSLTQDSAGTLRRHGVDGGLGRVIEVLPLTFRDEADHEALDTGDVLILEDLHRITGSDNSLTARRKSDDRTMELALELSARQRDLLRAGGLINWLRRRNGQKTAL